MNILLNRSFDEEFTTATDNDNPIEVYCCKEKLSGHIALMCPHCFNVIIRKVSIKTKVMIEQDIPAAENNIARPELWVALSESYVADSCWFCGKDDIELIDLDPNISVVISIFNKKGFKTKFSCEGHGKDESYIFFENDEILTHFNIVPLPTSWFVDEASYRDNIGCIIRAKSSQYEKALKDIENFANALPNLNEK